jgi:Ubiquitin elongating factor core
MASMQLSKQAMYMLWQLTTWSIEFFDNDVFAERVASMLNLVLSMLMGP